MGKFEDLLKAAREGDDAALDELEKEFGGSNLRDQAEAATAKLQENDPFIREGKFGALIRDNEIDGLTLSDVEEIATDDLTADLLREKAESKAQAKVAIQLDAAKDAGFETVEEFQEAMAEMKQKRTTTAAQAETIGGTVSRSGGTPTPPEPDQEPYDAALADFQAAKKGGMTDDKALGEATHTLMAEQHPAPEEAGV